jgi:hypothetical protein
VADAMVDGARAVVATGGSVRDAMADAVAEARTAMADAEARINAQLEAPIGAADRSRQSRRVKAVPNWDGSLEQAQ